MADSLALPHWTVAEGLPSTGNEQLDFQLKLRLQAVQENFESLVSQAAEQLAGAFEQRVPPGILQGYATTGAPTGYLPCDGAAVSRTTYADLFAVIGDDWGVGDGSTTFNVPTYNDGRFIRGNSTGGGTGGSNTTDPENEAAVNGYNITAPALGFAPAIAHTHDFLPAYRDLYFIIKT